MRALPKAIIVAAWLGCLGGGALLGYCRADPTRLTFIAVGQGDCAAFQHSGATILVDAGPTSNRFDAGERLAVPALQRLGVQTVDLALISHPDADHIGGLTSVARHFKVGLIAAPERFREHPDMLAALKDLRLQAKDVLWIGRDTEAQVGRFHLSLRTSGERSAEDNEGSLFVRIEGEGASAVFSGDASVGTEEDVAAHAPNWSAQVLKAGHHGSKRSTGDAWVRAMRPVFAVLSVGRNNRYGHPTSEVLRRLESFGVRVLRTDRMGDIRFVVGRHGFELDN